MKTSETPKPPPSRLKKTLQKISTLGKNLFCLAVWIWLTFRLTQQQIPFEDQIAQALGFLGDPTTRIVLQVSAATLLVFVLIFRWYKPFLKFLFFLWLRLVFFPVVALFYAFFIPYQTLRLTYKGISRFLDSFVRTTISKAAILLIVILPASVLIVLYSENSVWLMWSIVLTVFALLLTLRTAFYWTSKPLIIIEEIINAYERLVSWYLRFTIKTSSQSSSDPQKQYDSLKTQIDLCRKGIDWLHEFTQRNTDQRVILRVFFALFAICFLLTVFSFGIVYFAISKLDPMAFSGSHASELLDYVYSSLLVITTSGEITAVSGAAKLAVAGEIFCGIGLLTLLIFHFSMISIPEVMSKREEVLGILVRQKSDLNDLESDYAGRISQNSSQ